MGVVLLTIFVVTLMSEIKGSPKDGGEGVKAELDGASDVATLKFNDVDASGVYDEHEDLLDRLDDLETRLQDLEYEREDALFEAEMREDEELEIEEQQEKIEKLMEEIKVLKERNRQLHQAIKRKPSK